MSTVVGNRPYRFVPEVYGKPLVVAGFEPLDILASVHMLLQQIREGRCEVENQYTRVVRAEGNTQALKLMAEVFELRPHFEWRGLGFISQSALKLHPDFAEFDAERKFEMPGVRVADPKACQCGEVLKGVIKPWECKVFGTACTPETPIGTCMVSSEGACAAYYNFGRLHRETAQLLGQRSRGSCHGYPPDGIAAVAAVRFSDQPHGRAWTQIVPGGDKSPLVTRDVEVGAQAPARRRAARSPSSIAWAAVRPPNAVSTWSTSIDAPRTGPNWPSTSSWNSVNRTRPTYADGASASWHTRTGSTTSATLAPARLAASRYRGVDNTSPTAATSDSEVNGRTSCALP